MTAELLQTFNFVVRLTRTPVAVAALAAPPDLRRSGPQQTAPAGSPGRRVAPPLNDVPAAAAPGKGQVPDALGTGGFAECTGLTLEADLAEHRDGGRNDGIARGIGRVKLTVVVLKRGMFVPPPTETPKPAEPDKPAYANTALWDWFQAMVTGQVPLPRYDGHIEVLGPQVGRDQDPRRVLAHWSFHSGLPVKVAGPSLDAKTGQIAIEELHIAHEGLRLEVRAG
jgi:phage tail-like protein